MARPAIIPDERNKRLKIILIPDRLIIPGARYLLKSAQSKMGSSTATSVMERLIVIKITTDALVRDGRTPSSAPILAESKAPTYDPIT
jgi:hypothetical protein